MPIRLKAGLQGGGFIVNVDNRKRGSSYVEKRSIKKLKAQKLRSSPLTSPPPLPTVTSLVIIEEKGKNHKLQCTCLRLDCRDNI